MSHNIIASIRKLDQLRGSLFLTAVELAHRADGHSGVVHISYAYLADKAHCSRRTAIRHVKRLVELGIIRVQRFWRPNKKWLVNAYQFLIPWERPKPIPAHKSISDKMDPNIPTLEEREKYGCLRDREKGKTMILGWLHNRDGVLGRLLAEA